MSNKSVLNLEAVSAEFESSPVVHAQLADFERDSWFERVTPDRYILYRTEALWQVWLAQQERIDSINEELRYVLNDWNSLIGVIHARSNGTAVAEARELYELAQSQQERTNGAMELAVQWREWAENTLIPERDRQILSAHADHLAAVLKGDQHGTSTVSREDQSDSGQGGNEVDEQGEKTNA